jgi:tetratricopeptide (TPR) repeat protein
MRTTPMIAAVLSLFLLWGFVSAEGYIEMHDESGMTHNVLISALDWFDKGNQFYINNSYELAIACYNKSIELDPSFDGPWVNKGYCLKDLGRYDEALKAFDYVTRLNPLVDVWQEKGNILLNQGKYDEALIAYNFSIELSPKNKIDWLQKGCIFGLLGKYNESIKAFDKAITLISRDNYGWENKGESKFNESSKKFEAEKINPQLAYAWHYKGVALKALHLDTEADTAFAKAKELGVEGKA